MPPITVGIERVEDYADPDGSEGTLAIVIRASHKMGQEDGEGQDKQLTNFLTENGESLQVAVMAVARDYQFKAHRHNELDRGRSAAQEVIVVRSGSLAVSIYRADGGLVFTKYLYPGDVIILLRGGHGIRALTDSEFMEVKTGPYQGHFKDKTYIQPKK